MILFALLSMSAVCLALALVVLAGITWDAEDWGTPPAKFDSRHEITAAQMVIGIAFAFLIVTVVACLLLRDREALGVLPIAALVLCDWSGLRILLCFGGLRSPQSVLLTSGVFILALALASTTLGVVLMYEIKPPLPHYYSFYW